MPENGNTYGDLSPELFWRTRREKEKNWFVLWEKHSHLPTQGSRKMRYPWGRNLPSLVCKKSNQIKSTPPVTIKVYKTLGALSNLSPMSFFLESQPSKKYTSQSIKTICSGKGEVRARSLRTARKGSKPNPGNGSPPLAATGRCQSVIPSFHIHAVWLC